MINQIRVGNNDNFFFPLYNRPVEQQYFSTLSTHINHIFILPVYEINLKIKSTTAEQRNLHSISTIQQRCADHPPFLRFTLPSGIYRSAIATREKAGSLFVATFRSTSTPVWRPTKTIGLVEFLSSLDDLAIRIPKQRIALFPPPGAAFLSLRCRFLYSAFYRRPVEKINARNSCFLFHSP